MKTLPLFPLNTVLFPGTPLPLHIFEPRYRQMIGRCLEEDTPFGVVLIEKGSEVGAPATPHRVGTTARIARSRRLEDGRFFLIALGERRFRIEEVIEEQPYLTARVSWLEDEEDAASETDLVATVQMELAEYIKRLFELADQEQEEMELPEDAQRLSFVAAAVLQVGLEKKQALLEASSVSERLQAELTELALQREVHATLRRLKPTLGLVKPRDPQESLRMMCRN
jgi:Lon protease-like protein